MPGRISVGGLGQNYTGGNTGFDVGSDRSGRDGWFDESTVHFINIKSEVGGGACGDVGEGEHFRAFRAGSGSGGSAAGRQRRSSIYPQAFLVNLPRRAIAEALVLTIGSCNAQYSGLLAQFHRGVYSTH